MAEGLSPAPYPFLMTKTPILGWSYFRICNILGMRLSCFVQASENLHLVSYRALSLTLSIFMFVKAIDRSGTLETDGGDFLSTSSDHFGMIGCWQYV